MGFDDISMGSFIQPPSGIASSSPVIGGFVLLGQNMGDGMMCAGMGICEYSAIPIYNASVNTGGTAVSFQLLQLFTVDTFASTHLLIMRFNLSALLVNQSIKWDDFRDMLAGAPLFYSFGLPFPLNNTTFDSASNQPPADPNLLNLGLPADAVIYIPSGTSFPVDITGDVVTIRLTLVDAAGNQW